MSSAQPRDSKQRRFVCLHGHFYQPPRQNPWLGALERESSASPFHDWNERIDLECYRANAYSRINAPGGRIARIVNNYELMSFDFGPTLLEWLETQAPETYRRVIEGDRRSLQARSGHGNAMGHLYNHLIMPLAPRRDKQTQVRWGIADFERRFGRRPEGIWLAETAADLDTLEVLAEEGLRFTILSPRQALRWRDGDSDGWCSTADQPISVTRPYKVLLPAGKEIAVFFYDAGIVQEIAFGGLLADGDRWMERIMDLLGVDSPWPPILTIATDGETFGHHHKFADMAVAYLLTTIAERGLAEPTNPGAYLDCFPPSAEVEIVEPGSWSCTHGVERWQSDCGCSSGVPGWNQQWRRPLRDALDFLRAELDALYEAATHHLFVDPWVARDHYASLFGDWRGDRIREFLGQEQRRELSPDEQVRALCALEMQRNGQLMFTSCGWFFDDLAGHETGLVLRYAARAIELAKRLGGDPYSGFIAILARARSNSTGMGSGKDVYELRLSQSIVGMERIAAHHVLACLLGQEVSQEIYCYEVRLLNSDRWQHGHDCILLQELEVRSKLTLECRSYLAAAASLEGPCLRSATRGYQSGVAGFDKVGEALRAALSTGVREKVEAQLDALFGGQFHGLSALLPDLRGPILRRVTDQELGWARGFFDRLAGGAGLAEEQLRELEGSQLEAVRGALRYELGRRLKEEALAASAETGFGALVSLSRQAQAVSLVADQTDAEEAIELARAKIPGDMSLQPVEQICRLMEELTEVAHLSGGGESIWRLQNQYWALVQECVARKDSGDALSPQLVEALTKLADALDLDHCVLSEI